MSTYKLIQDVEAEDHILGPLTLRQFIFAIIAVFFLYLCFISITKHVAFLMVIFLPPALFFGFFAVPFGGDQPTEIWALAKIRFWIKPRKRIWDQSGIKELVTITVPKKIERVLTNGLSQHEVQSRLTALASTLDSRGWAVKNVTLGTSGKSPYTSPIVSSDSDRLIEVDSISNAVPEEIEPRDADILDEENSRVAQNFDQMINKSNQQHRQQLMDLMEAEPPQQHVQPITGQVGTQWFTPQITQTPAPVGAPDVLAQEETPSEVALASKLKAQHEAQNISYGNLRTLQPLGSQPPVTQSAPPQQQTHLPPPSVPHTTPADPAIMALANNDNFTIATIAREADKARGGDKPNNGEVVVSLR